MPPHLAWVSTPHASPGHCPYPYLLRFDHTGCPTPTPRPLVRGSHCSGQGHLSSGKWEPTETRAQQPEPDSEGGGLAKAKPWSCSDAKSPRAGGRVLCEVHTLLQTPHGSYTADVSFAGHVIGCDPFLRFPHPTAIFQTKTETPDKEPIKPHFFICFYYM